MNRKSLVFCLIIIGFATFSKAQVQSREYLSSLQDLMNTFSSDQLDECRFELDAPHRIKWSRFPGERDGLKLTKFNEKQKIAFHRFLRAFFPSQGYLKITAIMFNEDIQKKNEPVLGRNEYWFSVFGKTSEDGKWGWKLEGHHLSINMTLKGNDLISFTPVTFASNPAVAHSDGSRDGLAILYLEEELARKLISSFSEAQLAEGYSDRKSPDAVYGEINEDLKDIPDEGISIAKLTPTQLSILAELVREYVQNFHVGETATVAEILNEKARFFFIGSKVHGKAHYYKIDNGSQFIEYENYNNHIHTLWRNGDDFGEE